MHIHNCERVNAEFMILIMITLIKVLPSLDCFMYPKFLHFTFDGSAEIHLCVYQYDHCGLKCFNICFWVNITAVDV